MEYWIFSKLNFDGSRLYCQTFKVLYLENGLSDSNQIWCSVASIQGYYNAVIKIANIKKKYKRSTLTLGARKSVKVKGQGHGHIW